MLSPNEAAKQAGVSRRTIMVAIESKKLRASTNNRHHWKIDPKDFQEWMDGRKSRPSPSTETSTDTASDTVSPDVELLIKINGLETKLNAAEEKISDLKVEKEHWREMAQNLANKPEPKSQKPTRKWWIF